MDYSRGIMCVQWLEAAVRSPARKAVGKNRFVDPYRGGDSDVLTVYLDPEVRMYVNCGGFASKARVGKIGICLLALVEGDTPNYDGHKDSSQNDEPRYPALLILPWPAHPLASPPPERTN